MACEQNLKNCENVKNLVSTVIINKSRNLNQTQNMEAKNRLIFHSGEVNKNEKVAIKCTLGRFKTPWLSATQKQLSSLCSGSVQILEYHNLKRKKTQGTSIENSVSELQRTL